MNSKLLDDFYKGLKNHENHSHKISAQNSKSNYFKYFFNVLKKKKTIPKNRKQRFLGDLEGLACYASYHGIRNC